MLNIPSIIFVIPTFNDANLLEETVKSIQNRDCDPEKIFIFFVDFGSTDNTFNIITDLPQYHVGFFCLSGRPLGRTMRARATKMLNFQISGRIVVLFPGDVIYHSCTITCENSLGRASKENLRVGCIVSEVDIQDEDGTVCTPTPLFSDSALFRGFSYDSSFFVDRGYRRQIFTYGLNNTSVDKIGTYNSYIRHWNQLGYAGLMRNIIYIPKPLVRQKRFEPADELDDLLFRFETALTCFRMAVEQPETHVMDTNFESNFRTSLAKYALWRAWINKNRGNLKIAEDCFLMSSVINPTLCPDDFKDAWLHFEKFLSNENIEDKVWLSEWFKREDKTVSPKLPFGGLIQRLQRKWKIWRTNDQQSRFGS